MIAGIQSCIFFEKAGSQWNVEPHAYEVNVLGLSR